MKKIYIPLLVFSLLFSFAYNKADAATVGIKGGLTMPTDNLKNYDNTFDLGIWFDMGKVFFDNLNFRPGLDYFQLDRKEGKYADIWGIHFDWYWFFMGKKSIAPFIGFGPSLNYYHFKHYKDDSDAGIDLFFGSDFKISGPLTLLVEGRFKLLDIASLGESAFQLNVGIGYSF